LANKSFEAGSMAAYIILIIIIIIIIIIIMYGIYIALNLVRQQIKALR